MKFSMKKKCPRCKEYKWKIFDFSCLYKPYWCNTCMRIDILARRQVRDEELIKQYREEEIREKFLLEQRIKELKEEK